MSVWMIGSGLHAELHQGPWTHSSGSMPWLFVVVVIFKVWSVLNSELVVQDACRRAECQCYVCCCSDEGGTSCWGGGFVASKVNLGYLGLSTVWGMWIWGTAAG